MDSKIRTKPRTSGSSTRRLINVVFVLCLLVGSTNTLSAESQTTELAKDTNIRWLVFSSSKYEFERGLVEKKEYVHSSDLKYTGKIYIALADLKDDGSNELISYIDLWSFCGRQGCPFNIYEIHNKELYTAS